MTNKKKVTAAATAVVATALLFAGSFAWVSSLQTATNKFRQNDYNVQLHDVFEGKEVVTNDSETGEYTSETMEWTDTKDTLDKDVWVTNNGSGDILVSVRLTEEIHTNNRGTTFDKNAVTKLVGKSTSKAYYADTKSIRNYVEWQIGGKEWSQASTIMTFDEWKSLADPAQKVGKYWVIAQDGYMYWMEPLKASDSSKKAEASALGNTALVLDAVKLKDNVAGQVDYSIKVEMDAIDADLVGYSSLGRGPSMLKAAANAERVTALKEERDKVTNASVKNLYNDAINAALENKSDEEVNAFVDKAKELQALIDNDSSYEQAVITHDTENNVYKLENGETIDTKLAEWIAEKYGRSAITDVTKADLAALNSITVNSKSVQSFAGLTVDYFPNLTSIDLSNENGIDAADIAAMNDNMKEQLKSLTLLSCNNLQGSIDVSKFTNLESLSIRASKKVDSVIGLPSTLKSLNLEQSQIKTLDVQNCKNLEYINLWKCTSLGAALSDGSDTLGSITGLDSLTKLKVLYVAGSQLQTLNITSPELISLDISGCEHLTAVTLHEKAFTTKDPVYSVSLSIKNCIALANIDISKMTLIDQLDIRGCTKLLENVETNVVKNDGQTLITE